MLITRSSTHFEVEDSVFDAFPELRTACPEFSGGLLLLMSFGHFFIHQLAD